MREEERIQDYRRMARSYLSTAIGILVRIVVKVILTFVIAYLLRIDLQTNIVIQIGIGLISFGIGDCVGKKISDAVASYLESVSDINHYLELIGMAFEKIAELKRNKRNVGTERRFEA